MTLPAHSYYANICPLQAVTVIKRYKRGVFTMVCGNMATILIVNADFFNYFLINKVMVHL